MADQDKPDPQNPEATEAQEQKAQEQTGTSPTETAPTSEDANAANDAPATANPEGEPQPDAKPEGEPKVDANPEGEPQAEAKPDAEPEAEAPAGDKPEAAEDAKAEDKKKSKPSKPEPKKTVPRHSAFGALAKFLTEEQRQKLADQPEEPAVTIETRRDSDRRGRGKGPRDNRGRDSRGRENRGREHRGRDDRGGRDDRRPPREGRGRPDVRGKGPQRGPGRRGERPAPRLENVLEGAQKSSKQEANFAQGLLQALETEVTRFDQALGRIEGLDPKLHTVAVEQAKKLLDHSRSALAREVDNDAPLTISVVGGPGAGKTTLIEALAGDADAQVEMDENGRATTVWRGIRFKEQADPAHVDGTVEIRQEEVEHVPAGRPLVVIHNVRVNLHDGFALEKFVTEPAAFLGPEFRDDDESDPKVHLAAFNLATRPEHKAKSRRLRDASRFSVIEGLLARRLNHRAKLLRIHHFIDEIIEAVVPLRDYGLTVFVQSNLEGRGWQGRLAETRSGFSKWGSEERHNVAKSAKEALAGLRSQIEAFTNKHAGSKDAAESWAKRVEGLELKPYLESETARLNESFQKTAAELMDRSKASRSAAAEGPLPQPVLMTAVPQVFRDATSAFRGQLAAVVDPRRWIAAESPQAPEVIAPDALPEDKDQLREVLETSVTEIEKKLTDAITTHLVAGYIAPLNAKLGQDNKGLIDALFLLGREGHNLLDVVNEVLISLVQRLIERAAEQHRIRLPLIQKVVREPAHRTKMLVPPSRDLFMLAKRLQQALGERVDLVPAVDDTQGRIAAALLPAKIKPYMVKANVERRTAQVRIPRGQSGKAFGRNGTNQRLAASLVGFHLHLRIAKDQELADAQKAWEAEREKQRKAEAEAQKEAKKEAKKAAEEKPAAPAEATESPKAEPASPAPAQAETEAKEAEASAPTETETKATPAEPEQTEVTPSAPEPSQEEPEAEAEQTSDPKEAEKTGEAASSEASDKPEEKKAGDSATE